MVQTTTLPSNCSPKVPQVCKLKKIYKPSNYSCMFPKRSLFDWQFMGLQILKSVQITGWRRGQIPGLWVSAIALHESHHCQPQADTEPSFTMSHNAITGLPDPSISSKCLIRAVWQFVWFRGSYIEPRVKQCFQSHCMLGCLPSRTRCLQHFASYSKWKTRLLCHIIESGFEYGYSCFKNLICNPGKHMLSLYK